MKMKSKVAASAASDDDGDIEFSESDFVVGKAKAARRAKNAKPDEQIIERQYDGERQWQYDSGGEQQTKKPKKPRGDNRPGNIEDHTALDFARKHSGDSRYVHMWNRWLRWQADRWQHEDTLGAFDNARVLCREAGDAKAKTVAAVVTLARADRVIAATEMQWDTNKTIFNVPTREGSKK
jgi:hypothetical protein